MNSSWFEFLCQVGYVRAKNDILKKTQNGDSGDVVVHLLYQLKKQNNRTKSSPGCTKTCIVTVANVKPQQIRHKQSDSQQLQRGKQETALSDPHSSLLFLLLLYTTPPAAAVPPTPRNPISAYLSIRASEVHRWTRRYSRD